MPTLTAPAPTEAHWTCTPCGLRSTALTCPDEARLLAAWHDDLHHGGNATAIVEEDA